MNGHCVHLHYVIGTLGFVLILSSIFLLIWKCRKRKFKCGSVLCCSVKYEVHELPPKTSRDNPVYGHPNMESAPVEEPTAGCEIYQCQEEILNNDQKRLLRLCTVHKSTQTISGTWIYENYYHHQTIAGVTGRIGYDATDGFRKNVSMEYDYDYASNHETTRPTDEQRQSTYAYNIRQSRRYKTSYQTSRSLGDLPPLGGREKLSSLALDINDPVYYIDPNQCNSCLPPESASVPCFDAGSDSDDSGESDNNGDSHKMYLDETLLGYVDTLRRNHELYIQKYKSDGHKKVCSKTISCDISTKPRLKRANTGVLRLLEMERTKVHHALSVPVNTDATSVVSNCYFNTSPNRHRTPPSYRSSPQSCRRAPPCHTATTPRPCLTEEDYLKILS